MPKKRNNSIDIMKMIAVFMVLNSHMGICYGDYNIFATGGAIGDALFFFCSGFTILLSRDSSFFNYYKHRIARIYPTVIAVAIIASTIFCYETNVVDDIILGGGWFVRCIMIYYIPLYFIRRYCMNHFKWLWIITCMIIIGSYYLFFWDDSNTYFMYNNTYFKWIFFFLFMLYGGYVGSHYDNYKYSWYCFPMLFLCLIAWYSFIILSSYYNLINTFQYLSVIPLLGVIHYLYILSNHPVLLKLAQAPISGQIIYVIGGVCLESYLIQWYLITDKFNYYFPLNIPIIMIFILLVSYLVNFVANFISQTFKAEDYVFQKMFLHK